MTDTQTALEAFKRLKSQLKYGECAKYLGQQRDDCQTIEAALQPRTEQQPCIPEGTTMFRISRLILMLQETEKTFGDTCVYAQGLSWGAMALNRHADDKKAGIEPKSVEWSLPMDRKTIQMWIDKVNLPEAKEVLREYLRFKACEPPDQSARIAELEAGLQALYDAFLSRHGRFPLDRTRPSESQWNDAMLSAQALLADAKLTDSNGGHEVALLCPKP